MILFPNKAHLPYVSRIPPHEHQTCLVLTSLKAQTLKMLIIPPPKKIPLLLLLLLNMVKTF